MWTFVFHFLFGRNENVDSREVICYVCVPGEILHRGKDTKPFLSGGEGDREGRGGVPGTDGGKKDLV